MNSQALMGIAIIGLFSALAQYFLKLGVDRLAAEASGSVYSTALRAMTSPHLMLAGVVYVLVFGIYMLLLSRMDVSQAFPTTIGANILFITLMAFALLGEAVTIPRLLGIALITAGIYLVGRN